MTAVPPSVPSSGTDPRAKWPARLRPVEEWIFDLDNTLYPASSSLFPQIDLRMRRFIAEHLGLDLDEAFALQKRYYREYGTTLRGLMTLHGVDPKAFLEYVHDIDCSVLPACPKLKAALRRLPGRKVIFTNGSQRHAENVLGHLGLADQFDGIFDIRAGDYIPKPDAASYARMAGMLGLSPRRAAMFEDVARNLAPAAEAGMTTIWVCEEGHHLWSTETPVTAPDYVDFVTDDLAGWLTALTEPAGAAG